MSAEKIGIGYTMAIPMCIAIPDKTAITRVRRHAYRHGNDNSNTITPQLTIRRTGAGNHSVQLVFVQTRLGKHIGVVSPSPEYHIGDSSLFRLKEFL
jgi:hypothetical protein